MAIKKQKEELKVTSRLERLHTQPADVKVVRGDTYIETDEQYVEDNRVKHRTVLKKVDRYNEMKDYKVSDFYLDNLVALGAVDKLQQCTLQGSLDSSIENIEAQLANINKNISDNE